MGNPNGSTAAYLRLSYDRDGRSVSLDTQAKEARELASRHGLPKPTEYREPGNVGASRPRGPKTQYARLVQDVKAGRVAVLLVRDVDRLTRQPREVEDWIEFCEQHGLRIITMDGEVDTATPGGRLFLRMKANHARYEVEMKAARQKAANQHRAENGQPWRSGRRTFGYQPYFEGTVPDEADMVRHAFADVLNGVTLRSITRRWNADGSTSTLGNPWTTAALRLVLLNSVYCGRRKYNGVEVADLVGVERLVDPDTFAAVGAILRDPARQPSDRGGRGPLHLLSGLARCGVKDCGERLSYGQTTQRKGAAPYSVLRCRECLRLSRAAAPIEEHVVGHVLARLGQPGFVELFRSPAPDLGPLSARARDLRAQRKKLAEDLTVEQDFAIARDRRLREELTAVEQQIADLSAGSALAPFANGDDPDEVWKGLDLDAQRATIRELVDIVVLPVGRRGRQPFDPETVRVAPKGAR